MTAKNIEKRINTALRGPDEQVRVYKLLDTHYGDIPACHDCGKNGQFVVVEKDDTAWIYCGVCEVG